jgi:hypothetical protein
MQYAENLPSYALPLPGHVRQIQFKLFEWVVLRKAFLVAVNHPRPVYYNIWLEEFMGRYRVRKESGIADRTPDRRAWSYDTFENAEKEFDRNIKSKTNPFRKSPRKYAAAENKPQSGNKPILAKNRCSERPYTRTSGGGYILGWGFERSPAPFDLKSQGQCYTSYTQGFS